MKDVLYVTVHTQLVNLSAEGMVCFKIRRETIEDLGFYCEAIVDNLAVSDAWQSSARGRL